MVGSNPLYNALTANSLFNTPALASVSTARLVYQYTARLSVSVSGTGIVSRQHAQETIGINGYGVSTDIAYRLNRYQTISFNYGFTHFGYLGQFGQTDMHAFGGGYSVRSGRYWEFGISGGATRVASLRLIQLQIDDPVLVQELGTNIVFQKTDNSYYMPYASVHLTRSFRHSAWSASYDRSVVAGNGLYGTSNYQTAGSSYSYTGLRRLSLQGGVGFFQFSALTQSLGRYRSYGASGGLSYLIGKGVSSIARLDAHRYRIGQSSLDRTIYQVSFGLSWHPGDYPLALW
jgi:hypothetical protein